MTKSDVAAPPALLAPAVSPTVLSVFDGVPGLIGYWGPDLRNLMANEAYTAWFGLGPEKLRGMSMRDVLGASIFAANSRYIEKALAGKEQMFDRKMTDLDGRTRWTQTSYIPDEHDGVVRGFFELVIDITARVLADRARRRSVDQHRALARSLPSGFVLVFDDSLRFTLADGVQLGSFGLSRQHVEGRTLHEAMAADVAAATEPHYRAALRGTSTTWEVEVGRQTFQLTAGPVLDDDGAVLSGMVTAVDMTLQRIDERAWRALHAIARDVARNAAPLAIAGRVATALVEIFDVQVAVVVRFVGADTGSVVALAPRSEPAPSELRFVAGDETAAGRVHATGAAAMVRYDDTADGIAASMLKAGHRCAAAAPVRSEGQLWGAITIASDHGDRIDARVADRLSSFADLVELAIANSQSLDALEREATTDGLTGLPNRRAFDERLAREIERSTVDGTELSVAIMDVDHFKAINDDHGHPVGDEVLHGLAQRVSAASRDGDLVARIGGEEFGWIMPKTTGQRAVEAAERLRAVVGNQAFAPVGTLTVSLGVCSLGDIEQPDQLLTRADEALYDAKRSGRDRVCRFSAPAPTPVEVRADVPSVKMIGPRSSPGPGL